MMSDDIVENETAVGLQNVVQHVLKIVKFGE